MSSPDLSSLPTIALVETLKTSGYDVPRGLPEEIVRRAAEAIEPLSAIARDDALWSSEAPRDFMAPFHALQLLGAIGDAAGAPALVEAVKTRDVGDFLTEDAPSILAGLDPAAIPLLMDAALDRTLGTYQRNALAKGLYAIAANHPAHRAEVGAFFARILRDPDNTLVSLLVDDGARTDSPEVQAAVDAAFDEGRAGDGLMNREYIEHLRRGPRWELSFDIHDPMGHFENGILQTMKWSHEVTQQQRRGAAAPPVAAKAPKVGRNDPCPCGSGKKHKKCCL